MGKVKVPRGWKRRKEGKRIVYESDPPRVKIWKIDDFEKLKEKGRFVNVTKQDLNFSVKMENETSEEPDNVPETMDTDHGSGSIETLIDIDVAYHADTAPVSRGFEAVQNQRCKVDNTVRQLTRDTSSSLDHSTKLNEASSKLNNLRKTPESADIGLDDLKKNIKESDTAREALESLWSCCGIRDFFANREASASLEEMLLLSSLKGPLSDFPPNINQNVYSDIINFGLEHSRGTVTFLLNLLVRKEKPVEPKDTIRIAFIFSLLAHNISRDNNALAKTKSLLLQSQGLTVEGLDMLAKLGVCETGRSTLNQTDLLAEVSDSILRSTCKTICSQATIDNLDMMDQHMTIKYIEPEKIDTSHLNGDAMCNTEVRNLFDMKLVLMENDKNTDELNHIKKVVGNTVGRLLGKKVEKAKILRRFLPLNYTHPNSNKKKEPANILIQKPEGLQETVNAEMVEYLTDVQMKFLVDEVAEGALNKKEFNDDLKLATNKDTPEELRVDAEDRIKREVIRHGVWIGHGDLLTMSMFYVAKSLR